jgi:predicted secreted acid phosphatase
MRKTLPILLAVTMSATLTVSIAAPAAAHEAHHSHKSHHSHHARSSHAVKLAPKTHFTMKPDGSSGLTVGGENIPNIDSVKKTIAAYYGDPGTGIANKATSPYISEMASIVKRETKKLKVEYKKAAKSGQKPAIVFDADDTTLFTYDMEVGDMKFNFTVPEQDVWVEDERFPATPSMVAFVAAAQNAGFAIFGITGRGEAQEPATLGNLSKVGYTAFNADNFYTKWATTQPSYVTCAAAKCTTVEYKANTRKHIESLGYDIALNVGDQFSDLEGGYADRALKLPNPTYYLPSANLPGVVEKKLTPRTHFTMKPDGSSGLTQGGEGIPNIDSVKLTLAAYEGDTGTGTSNKTTSPYISQMKKIVRKQLPKVVAACAAGKKHRDNPAIVLDADDTTLWTYDMENAAMHYNFDPALQDVWVQNELFPATPHMVSLVSAAKAAGCTIVGLTGRSDAQKAATIANLAKVGYTGFTAANYYTKWTGTGASTQPSYITCAAVKCTTIEYKSQTRKYIESKAGGNYDIVANFGDQFSDLIGGHADRSIKLPNPTYYLP